jgi:hypothetical protein
MNRKITANGKILGNQSEMRQIWGRASITMAMKISTGSETFISYSVFHELKSMKLKRNRKSNEMKWNETDIPSAMNPTLIRDTDTNYCLNFIAGMLRDRHLLTTSRILGSENLDIRLRSVCKSDN